MEPSFRFSLLNEVLVLFMLFDQFLKKSFVVLTLSGTSMGMMMNAHAVDIKPSKAQYNFSLDGKTGNATRTLSKNGDSWRFEVNARAAKIATAEQTATFWVQEGKVMPNTASTSYKVFGLGNTHRIQFDPNKKQVISTYKGKSTTLAMPKAAYDDLTLELQIRQELLNNKFTGNYELVKKSSIDKVKFKKASNEKIRVPAGEFDTIRIDRVHGDSQRKTRFWLAPSLDYTPVKVEQIKDGEKMLLELKKFE